MCLSVRISQEANIVSKWLNVWSHKQTLVFWCKRSRLNSNEDIEIKSVMFRPGSAHSNSIYCEQVCFESTNHIQETQLSQRDCTTHYEGRACSLELTYSLHPNHWLALCVLSLPENLCVYCFRSTKFNTHFLFFYFSFLFIYFLPYVSMYVRRCWSPVEWRCNKFMMMMMMMMTISVEILSTAAQLYNKTTF